jgi:uncharacterized membrane protein YiaA
MRIRFLVQLLVLLGIVVLLVGIWNFVSTFQTR